MNSFQWKIGRTPYYLWANYFLGQFINNFSSLLLWKISVFDFFNMLDFFQIFVTSRSTEILIALVKVSDWNLFRINPIPKSVSELIKTHPSQSEKKFQSRLMETGRKSIRLNPRLRIRMNPDSIGLRTSFGLSRIGSLELSRIEFWLGLKISDWYGLIFNRFTSNEIENFFRIESNEFGLARIQISEWIGINLIGSEWISIQDFYQRVLNFWLGMYKLVAYRWKRRLVPKSGGIGVSAVVCIYVCMYVLYVFYTNSWCPNRAYGGHEVALITSQGDKLQAYWG